MSGKNHILAGPMKTYLMQEAKTKVHKFNRVADETLQRADREAVAAARAVLKAYKPRKHVQNLIPRQAIGELMEDEALAMGIVPFKVQPDMLDKIETSLREWADGHVARLPSVGKTI